MEPATHHGECELATPPIPHSHRMHHQPWLHSSWSCPASGSYPSWYFSALHSEWQARIFCDDYYVNASIWNVKLMRVHPKVFFFNHFNQAFLLLCPLDTLLYINVLFCTLEEYLMDTKGKKYIKEEKSVDERKLRKLEICYF